MTLFKLLRKEVALEWNYECEVALTRLKKALFQPPTFSRPEEGEISYLYLFVAFEVVSVALLRETKEDQKLVYFMRKALQKLEIHYHIIEKVASYGRLEDFDVTS